MGSDGAIAGTWECNSGGSAHVRWTEGAGFSGTGAPIIFTSMAVPMWTRDGLGR